MTEKQFNVFDVDGTIFLEDHKKGSYHIGEIGNVDVNCLNDIADRLNELNDEKERWKSMCLSSSSENSILWNEISILREQGAEPSDAFKKYLESISTDYDKFWRRKLKQAKRDKVIE